MARDWYHHPHHPSLKVAENLWSLVLPLFRTSRHFHTFTSAKGEGNVGGGGNHFQRKLINFFLSPLPHLVSRSALWRYSETKEKVNLIHFAFGRDLISSLCLYPDTLKGINLLN